MIRIDCPYRLSFGDIQKWFAEEKKKYPDDEILVSEFNGNIIRSDMDENELYFSVHKMSREDYEKWRMEMLNEPLPFTEEIEELEKKRSALIKSRYGSEENYRKHLIECMYKEGEKYIDESLHGEWMEFVTENSDRCDLIAEITNYLYILNKDEYAIRDKIDEIEDNLRKESHSGTTATFVLGAFSHFGGKLAKQIFEYIG